MEKINEKKRGKLKLYLTLVGTLIFYIFFSNIDWAINKVVKEKYDYNIVYDDDGFITKINNNGKVYNFDKAKLIGVEDEKR